MTSNEVTALRSMSTAHVRRNYHLCDAQLAECRADHERGSGRLDDAATTLQAWQDCYLNELVRRGARI